MSEWWGLGRQKASLWAAKRKKSWYKSFYHRSAPHIASKQSHTAEEESVGAGAKPC